jgi:hypothetical protein
MSCDICWRVIDDSDIDAEFESDDLVICSDCRSNHGEKFSFEKF